MFAFLCVHVSGLIQNVMSEKLIFPKFRTNKLNSVLLNINFIFS